MTVGAAEYKGLTQCLETMRGFVATRGISNEPTKQGRKRQRFILFRGTTDLANLKVPTIRVCVAYDENAEKLADIHSGELIIVDGYVLTSVKKDYTGKPFFLATGEPVTVDTIIINKASRINYQGKQYRMLEDKPPGAENRPVDVLPDGPLSL